MYNTDIPTRAELPSSRQLLRSTALAALVAAMLLITAVLPAEYGIDPTGIGRALGLTQMGETKATLATEATGASPATPADVVAPSTAAEAGLIAVKGGAQARQDTVTLTLKPGQAAEVKLVMRKDATVQYDWSTAGGTVNVDTHGDAEGPPKIPYHGYGKGKDMTADAGTLKAAFDGHHGWFWRNRSKGEVNLILKIHGAYQDIKRVL